MNAKGAGLTAGRGFLAGSSGRSGRKSPAACLGEPLEQSQNRLPAAGIGSFFGGEPQKF